MRRLKQEELNLKQLPDGEVEQKNAKLTAIAETETTLQQLQANPPIGRVVVRIPSDAKVWREYLGRRPSSRWGRTAHPEKSGLHHG